MDSKVVKKFCKNNKPSFRQSLKGEYTTVRDVIKMYETLFDKLKFIYLYCKKEEERQFELLAERTKEGTLSKNDQIVKNYEELKTHYKAIYDAIRKYTRVFPIYVQNKGCIVSENINCLDNIFKIYNVPDDLFNEHILDRILGDFKLYDSNKDLLTSINRKDLDEKQQNQVENILNLPVNKSSIPEYLYICYDIKLRVNTLTRQLEKFNLEYDSLTKKEKDFITFENVSAEKKYAEERAKAREEKIKEQIAKKEQLKAQMLGILHTLDSMTDESTTKIQKYPVSKEVLFIKGVDGVVRIDERFIPVLKYIDLSGYGFENVDISGIDFSDCNVIHIDPQKVFNKDLSNTIFIDDQSRINNIFPFNASCNFEGVNLSGAQINIDKPIFINFNGAITDSNTIIKMGDKIIETTNKKVI